MISSCCSSASDSSLKQAVLIAITTPPPPRSDRSLLNIVKPEGNISGLLTDILVQPCFIDAHNVRVFGVHQVLETMKVIHGLPVCWAVFVITFYASGIHPEAIDLTSSRSRNRSGVRIDVTRRQEVKGSI